MKLIAPIILLLLALFSISSAQLKSIEGNETKIEELISKMTLEEKVGQMTQVALQVITKEGKERVQIEPVHLDLEKVRELILKYKIGSFLNTGQAANSLEKWHEIITQLQDITLKESRLKIPIIYGIDAIHGATYTLGSTLFPQSFAIAASRNRELVRKSAEITALETRASGIPWNFNPVLGLGREPYWPRFWETFGEDSYLASELGYEYAKGMQGEDLSNPTSVVACLKHYIGYSVPNNGLDRTPSWIPDRALRDLFLPPFAKAVEAGALTVMVNSAELNGIPVHSSYYLMTKILKEELGFQGFIVSDWLDVKRLHSRDGIAETPKEAVKLAVLAGLDMSMVPLDVSFAVLLIELVEEGVVPILRIDDAVRRILRVKFALNLFEKPYPDRSLVSQFATKESAEVSRIAAQESITLLKNENSILPLKIVSKILLTGPTANKLMYLNGGWSYVWQGNNEELYPNEKHTFYEALQSGFGKENVNYIEGVKTSEVIDIESVVEAAKDVDYIIASLGEEPYCETPGNIFDLTLDEAQLKLVEELSKTGKPIILVLFEGRPRVINKIVDKVDAIVMGYLPGSEGADAMVDILLGKVNPSGKLPFTYPRFPGGNTTYDHKPIEESEDVHYTPQWPFGFGLSYTTFEYSNLTLSDAKSINDKLTVSVTVKNAGKVTGKESVELYITDLFGTVSRPSKLLKGFDKIELIPGESKQVEFLITPEHFSFHNRKNQKVVEPGDFIITIGNLKKKINLK
ncbi:MAG: glycoside hydrolase family 3 C-terminal domain-containing protein [Melioribacteraceae bacterium]|jgi:beta-glucosidase|nr:glycoside hydrolase family 3 C-terminal domain-containing protein [Melioribacteraceae bacterium]